MFFVFSYSVKKPNLYFIVIRVQHTLNVTIEVVLKCVVVVDPVDSHYFNTFKIMNILTSLVEFNIL